MSTASGLAAPTVSWTHERTAPDTAAQQLEALTTGDTADNCRLSSTYEQATARLVLHIMTLYLLPAHKFYWPNAL